MALSAPWAVFFLHLFKLSLDKVNSVAFRSSKNKWVFHHAKHTTSRLQVIFDECIQSGPFLHPLDQIYSWSELIQIFFSFCINKQLLAISWVTLVNKSLKSVPCCRDIWGFFLFIIDNIRKYQGSPWLFLITKKKYNWTYVTDSVVKLLQ